MKNIFILSLFSLLLLAVRCPKNDSDNPSSRTTVPPEVLPPATQTGANTFGFLLNGKVWLPQGPGAMTILDAQYYRGLFLLSASKDSGPQNTKGINQIFQTITMSCKPIYTLGTYYFKSTPYGGPSGAGFIDYTTNCDYETTDQDSLQTHVTITKLDSINRIVSGTFSFLFVPPGSGCDTIKITNGRFDMKYEF